MTDATRLRFALALPLLLAACADKSQPERCDELSEYLAGREQILERDCLVDDECEVVFIRPDRPIAARAQPRDPQLARVIATYRESCGAIPRAEGALAAVCIERVIDVPNPDDPLTTIEENIGRACVLRGSFSVPDSGSPDATDAGDTAADAYCACAADSACAQGETCHACSCVPDTLCGQACVAADDCGMLSGLGLGSDAAVCAAGCEASLANNPSVYQAFVQCLRASACGAVEDCGDLIP